MKVNDKVVINKITYEVLGTVGAGGQGAVWKVKNTDDGKIYALKVINEKNTNRRLDKVANIKRLVNIKADLELQKAVNNSAYSGINHACPLSCYTDINTHETGYVMEMCVGKTLNDMLLDGTIERMSINDKLRLLKQVAASIDMLHTIGYCYTDINWGNFLWNAKTETIYVIDCENIACNADIQSGKCSFLIGTGFFIAPEVAFGKAKAAYNSDNYALASLIFRVLTNNAVDSAYHGVAMYSAKPACQNMLEVAEMELEGDIDPNWRKFIFDRNDKSNSLDNLCKGSKNPENIKFRAKIEQVIAIWEQLDPRLKDMFYKAFTDPFDINSRPTPSLWVRTIDGILNGKPIETPQQVQPKPANVQPLQAQQVNVQKYPTAHCDNQGAFIQSKYQTFVPAGGVTATAVQQQPITTPNGPYLMSTKNIAMAISDDDFVVEGPKFGLVQNIIGCVKKTSSGYAFVSQMLSRVEILDANGHVRSSLSKGQITPLKSGESIKPVLSTISIKIVY